MLALRGLKVVFAGQKALDRLDLSLREGEILCLLGPSGCGKTTLLRVIAGLETAEGEIILRGRALGAAPPHERGFGLMFQDLALFPHKNVAENVAFGLRMRRARDIEARVAEILALVGLERMAARDVSALSGGEQQRVALARSLAPRPQLLMLDEPLGSLDAGLRERLVVELRQILAGQTALYVTHDQQEAFAIADRIAVMQAGRIVQIAAPPELYNRPRTAFVARFLGLGNVFPADLVARWTGVDTGVAQALIHPAGIRLAEGPGDAPQPETLLVGRVFAGERWKLTCEIGGRELHFALDAGAADIPAPGARLRLAIDPGRVLPLHPA